MFGFFFLPYFIWQLYDIYKMRKFEPYMKHPLVKIRVMLCIFGVCSSIYGIIGFFMVGEGVEFEL